MKYRLLALFFAMVLIVPSMAAQPAPVRFGIDPKADSLAFRQMRAKMAKIRKHRPTVALVLSGGGAKGACHVGVIRYLEEIGMPIDLVVGTSVGGLMGGFLALGYNADEIEEMIHNIDWSLALSDRIPREYISYYENKYREKFLLSIPFYYAKEDRNSPVSRYDDIHFSADKGDVSSFVRDNLLGSLPSGMVYGQNVNNIFNSVSVGYQDSLNFFKLPIPYACVATEMVTSQAKIWHSGHISTALRSTMSIPGLFTPVRTEGMVLVDGGMRNNYPTDLARTMGADYIIGVDLSSGYKNYSSLNNLGDIIGQGIDMLGRSSYEKNVSIVDVSIKPDVDGYGMMSFERAAIDTLMQRGYMAAIEQAGELAYLKAKVGKDTLRLQAPKAVDITHQKVMISSVTIEGVTDRESRYLMGKLEIPKDFMMDRSDIEAAVATIYGTKSFDYVTFSLEGKEEPYRLVFNCKKGPVHQIGVGVRFDTEEIIAAAVNLGFNVHRLQGHSLELTGKLGSNPGFQAVYGYAAEGGSSVKVSTGIHHTTRNLFTMGNDSFNIDYTRWTNKLYRTNMSWSRFNVEYGVRHDFFKVGSMMTDGGTVSDDDLNNQRNHYVSLFVDMLAETFDDGYFPTRGLRMGLSYGWTFASFPTKKNNFHAIKADFKWAIPLGGNFTFLPMLRGRMLLGEDIPLPFMNVMGGIMDGRYMEQQFSFIGVNNCVTKPSILAIAGSEFRYKIYRNNYLSAIVNVAGATDEPRNVSNWNTDQMTCDLGVGLQYGYDTVVGPLFATLHWSSVSRTIGAYLGLGFYF